MYSELYQDYKYESMYTTGKPLKEGSDSKVYLATHKTEDKIYAAKIISCEPEDTVKS